MEEAEVSFLASWFGGLFYGLGWSDFELTIDLIVWSLFVWYSLGTLDVSDFVVGMMYVAYCVFLGFALAFALPQKHNDDPKTMFLYFVGFAVTAAARWVRAYMTRKSKA